MKITQLVFLGVAAYLGYVYYIRYEAGMDAVRSAKSSSNFSDGLLGPQSQGGIGPITTINEHNQTSHSLNYNTSSSPTQSISSIDLLEAAAEGDIEKVRKILADKVPVDSRDGGRRTPLMYAAWNGHNDLCAILLAAGANIDFRDRQGFGALDFAAGRGRTDTVTFLLSLTNRQDTGHHADYAKLINAVNNDDIGTINGLRISKTIINRITPENQSALHISASNGYKALVEVLVGMGANVNLQNASSQTPLHWAAWNNQTAVIDYLIKHGAKVSTRDSSGNTPLLMAVQNNSAAAVKALITYGAEKNPANKQGQTAMLIANDKGYNEIIDLLR